MTKYLSCLISAAALLLASCASTPASRIADNAELYYKLSPEHRALVEQGRIDKGMPPSAVFLAWGHPSSVSQGDMNGQNYTRWIYTQLQPVVTPGFGMGYWGGPGYWGHRGGAWGGGYYDDVTYIPVDAGYVLFKKDVVDSWEKRMP